MATDISLLNNVVQITVDGGQPTAYVGGAGGKYSFNAAGTIFNLKIGGANYSVALTDLRVAGSGSAPADAAAAYTALSSVFPDAGGAATTTYLVYTALLTQSGTDAPVATVLENTLGGTVVWTYSDVGYYVATLADAFTENKTFILTQPSTGKTSTHIDVGNEDQPDQVYLATQLFVEADVDFIQANGELLNTPIEIRVYP